MTNRYTVVSVGCPRNKQKKCLVSTETNRSKIWFGCVSICFGVSNLYQNNRNKQNCFETNQNNPKFFWKILKYALYQTVSVGLLFFSVQLK